MESLTPQQWTAALREDLTVDGENIPFERALRRHLDGLVALRARGLTWPSLANLLRKNGVTRQDGRFYSADHLRVAYDRLMRNSSASADSKSLPQRMEPRSDAFPKQRRAARSTRVATPIQPVVGTTRRPENDKDISSEELARIAARLNKTKP